MRQTHYRARSSFLEEKKSFWYQIYIKCIPFFALLSSSVFRTNLSCVDATIFSSLAFLSTSISMANLSCLLATTFSRYRDAVHRYRDVSLQLIFITSLQSFGSSLALILVVFCYWRPFLLPLVVFFLFFLLYLFHVLSSAFLSSVLQSQKLYLL